MARNCFENWFENGLHGKAQGVVINCDKPIAVFPGGQLSITLSLLSQTWITGTECTLSKLAGDSKLEAVSATADVWAGSQHELDRLKFNKSKSASSVPGE